MKREDIQIIANHSNWSEKGVDKALKQHVYNDKESWRKFLRLFFFSLGISFTTAGVIFFFAYNWSDLHKFAKIGLIEGIIIVVVLVAVFSKLRLDIKNILLTGASMLVGVLFAVFGQIYQTGANAYDFFLGWTMAISIWAVISNFAPLWLVLIALVNTTLILYWQQVAYEWSEVFIIILLFIVNVLFLVIALIVPKIKKTITPPIWFTNVVALLAIFYSTIGMLIEIISRKEQTAFYILLAISFILYGAGILYGLKNKRGFYLSIIPFSIIIITSTFLIRIADHETMILLVSLFVIGSVTLLINSLINLQKKWRN